MDRVEPRYCQIGYIIKGFPKQYDMVVYSKGLPMPPSKHFKNDRFCSVCLGRCWTFFKNRNCPCELSTVSSTWAQDKEPTNLWHKQQQITGLHSFKPLHHIHWTMLLSLSLHYCRGFFNLKENVIMKMRNNKILCKLVNHYIQKVNIFNGKIIQFYCTFI